MLDSLSTGAKGAWAELVAAEVLLGMGLNVYRNVSPNGRHDLVIENPTTGKFLGIDITLGSYCTVGNGTLKRLNSTAKSKHELKGPGSILVVTREREVFFADLRYTEVIHEGLIYKYTIDYTALTLDELYRRIM